MNQQNQHTPTPFEAALKLADEISRLDLDSVTKERVHMTNLIRAVIQQREASLVADIEAARVALGEHPEDEINLAARIRQLRQEARNYFHDYSKAYSANEELVAENKRLKDGLKGLLVAIDCGGHEARLNASNPLCVPAARAALNPEGTT